MYILESTIIFEITFNPEDVEQGAQAVTRTFTVREDYKIRELVEVLQGDSNSV